MNEQLPPEGTGQSPTGLASALVLAGTFTLREIRNALAPLNISPVQYTILEECYRSGGSTVSAIAAKLPIATSAISRQADQMFEEGLLDRVPNNIDRRVMDLRLTDKGMELMPSLMEAVRAREEELGNLLTEQEREVVISMARKYLAALGASL